MALPRKVKITSLNGRRDYIYNQLQYNPLEIGGTPVRGTQFPATPAA